MGNKQSCVNMPLNVNILIPEGRSDGLRLVTKTGWNGLGIVCPRSDYIEAKKRPEFKRCGVYILLGEDARSGTPVIYIGETNKIFQRLNSHYQKKDFWQQAIIFTSESNTLNKAVVQCLEAKLMNLARANGQCRLVNRAKLKQLKLSESVQAEADWYFKQMDFLLPILGITVFEAPKAITGGYGGAIDYYFRGSTFCAKGYETRNNGFVVYAGSTAVSKFRKHAMSMGRLYAIRQELIRKKVLKKITNEDRYKFTDNHRFNSPSTAAAICNGRSTNGRIEWKDENGVSLKKRQDDRRKKEIMSEGSVG